MSSQIKTYLRGVKKGAEREIESHPFFAQLFSEQKKTSQQLQHQTLPPASEDQMMKRQTVLERKGEYKNKALHAPLQGDCRECRAVYQGRVRVLQTQFRQR